MSKSIRFLGLALFAWAGVRAVSLGVVPGTEALAFDSSAARRAALLPKIEPTTFPPIDPVTTVGAPYPLYSGVAPFPVYVPVSSSPARSAPPQIIYVNPAYADAGDTLDRGNALAEAHVPFELPPTASGQMPKSTPSLERPKPLRSADRLSVTGWAMMRNEGGRIASADGERWAGAKRERG